MSVETGQQEIHAVTAGSIPLYRPGAGERATRSRSMGWIVAPLYALDMACIALSMWIAYHLRFHLIEYRADFSPVFYTRLGLIAILTWGVIFAFYKLYHPEHLFGGVREYGNVINACTMGMMGLIVYSFLDRSIRHDISRGWLAIVWFLSIVSIGLARFGYRRMIYYLRRRGLLTRKVLIVGVNAEGLEVAAQLRGSPSAGMEIVGFVDSDLLPGTTVSDVPVLGNLDDLGSLVRRTGVQELIVIPTALEREKLLDIYRDWGKDSQVEVCLSSGLYELFTTGVRVREVGSVPLVSVDRIRITGVDAFLKAMGDYIVSLMAFVVLGPVFALIAFLIRRDSPGPAIYRRRVVGLHGRVFDAFKFRTMVVDAEACLEACPELKQEWEETGKIRDDPRITRMGRWLRRFSLDELPQLLNVLKGEMSLVGPRMITLPELRHFGRWQHNLLTVKPGLTGLWQTNGRSDVSYDERVRLDMYYIRNHNVWLDLKVLVNTVSAVLKGKGAY